MEFIRDYPHDLRAPIPRDSSPTNIWSLPDDLQIKILSYLPVFGPIWHNEEIPLSRCLPYTCYDDDRNDDPMQGYRVAPFIPQVCKKWRDLVKCPQAHKAFHRHLVIDFGHELLNGIFYPIKFQSSAMPEDVFHERLSQSKLTATALQGIVSECRHVMTALTLNVEGLWHKYMDGDKPVGGHAEFDEGDLCFLLGIIHKGLQRLALHNRHGRLNFDTHQGLWNSIAACTGLRSLSIHGTGNKLPTVPVTLLGKLSVLNKLQELTLTGFESASVGLIPLSWSCLTCLTSLEIALPLDHMVLPPLLRLLPLRRLHLSSNLFDPFGAAYGPRHWHDLTAKGDLHVITMLTQLEVLSLQGTEVPDTFVPFGTPISLYPGPGQEAAQGDPPLEGEGQLNEIPLPPLVLPDLSALSSTLRVLSLTGTLMTRLPPHIFRLSNLEILDLRGNSSMWILGSLSPFLALYPHLRLLDLRNSVSLNADGQKLPIPRYTISLESLPWLTPSLKTLIIGDDHVNISSDETASKKSPGGKESEEGPHVDESRNLSVGKDEIKPMGKDAGLAFETYSCYWLMQLFIDEAKAQLEARPPWQPGPGWGNELPDGGEGRDRHDAWSWLPDWRRPSAGGPLHGPGPWLLHDFDSVGNT